MWQLPLNIAVSWLVFATALGPVVRTQGTDSSLTGIGVVLDSRNRAEALLVVSGHKLIRVNARTGSIAWQKALPNSSAGGPVIAGNVAIVPGCSGGYCLYGFDAASGDLLWSLGDGSSQWAAVDGRSVMLVSDGKRVYSTGRFPESVFAIDPGLGKIIWSRETKTRPKVQGSPHVGVIVPVEGRLVTDIGILDAASGRTRHELAEGRVVAADGRDGLLAVASADGSVTRWHPQTLEPIWTQPTERGAIARQVLIGDTTVAVADISGEMYVSMDARISVFDAQSGKALWKTAVHSTQVITPRLLSADREHIYVCYTPSSLEQSGKVVAYGAQDGKIGWTYRLANNSPPGGVVVLDGLICLRDGDTLVALDSRTGGVQWRCDLS